MFERIAILGAGSMGQAILAGLLRAGVDSSQVAASVNSNASAQKLSDEFGITAIGREGNDRANVAAVAGA